MAQRKSRSRTRLPDEMDMQPQARQQDHRCQLIRSWLQFSSDGDAFCERRGAGVAPASWPGVRARRSFGRRDAARTRSRGRLRYGNPRSQSSNPMSEIPNPMSENGFPTPENEFPPSENGFPPSENGFPTLENGFPTLENGFPPSENGFPTPENQNPMSGMGHPCPWNGIPWSPNGGPRLRFPSPPARAVLLRLRHSSLFP